MTPLQIRSAIVRNEPDIMSAFLAWVAETVSDASVSEIEQLVELASPDRIAEALGITAASLSALLDAIREAYVAGGLFGLTELPRLRAPRTAAGAEPGPRAPYLRVRFDVRNLRAEAWLRQHSAALVTRILTEQREAIRTVLQAGAFDGRNPRVVALDIIGRLSPQTGRRTGGIIGLTQQQAGYVTRARAQLLSGDPAQMREYLTRVRRDARFDSVVQRAITAGRQVPRAQVERIVGRYSDRLLQLRGEVIARTEALAAFNEARDEAARQAIEQAEIPPNAVTKSWRTAADSRVRQDHAAMSGQRVRFDEPFRAPSGALLMHPGDTSLGAGAADVIQCRCVSSIRIDHLRAVRRGR